MTRHRIIPITASTWVKHRGGKLQVTTGYGCDACTEVIDESWRGTVYC